MIGSTGQVRVYAYREPADMRKSFNTLAALVVQELGRDIMSGDIFLFVGRTRKLAKLIYWDGTGLCLFAKRLAKGCFAAPWAQPGDRPPRSAQGWYVRTEGSKVLPPPAPKPNVETTSDANTTDPERDEIADLVANEDIPSDPTDEVANNPNSDEHKEKVIAAINHFLVRVERSGNTGVETYRDALERETRARRESEKHSRSLILRDAQRFFYGTVGPYMWSDPGAISANDKGKRWEESPAPKVPSKANLLGIAAAAFADTAYSWQKEFFLTLGLEKANRSREDRPTSGVGGSQWYDIAMAREDRTELESWTTY